VRLAAVRALVRLQLFSADALALLLAIAESDPDARCVSTSMWLSF
jgi:hypothetical protein